MEHRFLQKHPFLKDSIGVIVFIISIIIGTLIINTFIFRSFNVIGPSMESTFFTGDRLIVNRVPVTMAQLQNKPYIPERGQIIVFKNPTYIEGQDEEYIVKRVIGFPGERVVVKGGKITVYNEEHKKGFNPDDLYEGEGSPTSGNIDVIVADGTLFVAGDHREGTYSFDSRSGLGNIPFYNIVGPVGARIFPFTKISLY